MKDQQRLFVLSLLSYANQRNVPLELLSRRIGVDVNRVDFSLSESQLEILWRELLNISKDPLFGLHFGESLQLQALGVVGDIIKTSATVGDAVGIAASLIPLITDHFYMEVSKSAKSFSIELHNKMPIGDLMKQMADVLMVFTVHELDGLLLKKVKPLSASFSYPIVEEEYSRVFRTDNLGEASVSVLEFDTSLWNEVIITADRDLQRLLLEKIGPALTKQHNAFKERVLHFLMSNSFLGVVSLQDVAANFNMSTRTLQRKLSEDGVTFQELSESARKNLALHYLQAGNYPIKAISNMLGYNELSAFSRAFKRWTGKAPANY